MQKRTFGRLSSSASSWLSGLQKRRLARSVGATARRLRGSAASGAFAGLEALEGRALMSGVTVTTTADSGPGSLRDAIEYVNAHAGSPQTIDFSISGSGLQTIQILSPLPAVLADDVTIDATTQPGYAVGSGPVVQLDGSWVARFGSGPVGVGLEVSGARDSVKGLWVEGFADAQLVLSGSGGGSVTGGVYGVGVDFLAPGVQNANGIVVSSAGNVIGGTTDADRNVISAGMFSGWNGVLITGDSNVVSGNYIGVDASGSGGYGNKVNGIEVDGAANVTISYNVVTQNGESGIVLDGVNGAVIVGNIVGLDSTGEMWLGNRTHGISVIDSTGVTIGGVTAADRNVISGNDSAGVFMLNSSAVWVAGNFIGLDATGTKASDGDGNSLGNSANGVYVIDSTGVTIGGAAAGARNVISGNAGSGVAVQQSSGTAGDVLIVGNYVGTDRTGLLAADVNGEIFGNQGDGISLYSGAATIGGIGLGNVIAGNVGQGITLADGSVVKGNLIGVAADGVMALGNGFAMIGSTGAGVYIAGSDNVVGGTAAGEGNVIRNNTQQGVAVGTGTGNVIRGNAIDRNARIGIDLGDDGVTLNDSLGHVGANGLANYPVIDTAAGTPTTLHVTGSFTAAPGVYQIDFYTSPLADDSGYGEGATYVGTASVTVGTGGTATFDVTFSVIGGTDAALSATSTDSLGNTSEFALAVTVDRSSGPVPDATSTTVTSSSPVSTFGTAVTFSATVTDLANVMSIPTGLVHFIVDGAEIGSAALDASGHASIAATLGIGTHSVVAVYDGEGTYLASASGPISHEVNKATTTTMVSSSANPSVIGQGVTIVASVSTSATGAGTPFGTVTFRDGTTELGTVAIVGGQASVFLAYLPVGGHTITATYNGDVHFDGSSDSLTQTVNKDSTTTTLSTSYSSLIVGQSHTFTATVTAGAGFAGTPYGTVTFKEGSVVVGTATLAGGVATLVTSTLPAGHHVITAEYAGTEEFEPSVSGPVSVDVVKAGSTTTVSSSNNPAVVGQGVTYVATVTGNVGWLGTPSGTVTFKDGTLVIGTASVAADGTATLLVSGLAAGPHAITATYGGDANFETSGGSLAQVVNKDASTTTLGVSSGSPTVGQSVTFTATVAGVTFTAGNPAGTVTFMEGSTILGTGTLSGGVATFSTAGLSVGSHTVTAVYGGDGTFNASASAPVTVNVAPAVVLGTITGRVLTDLTGNGLSADDTGLGGVTVYLYRDLNGDGDLDASDGGPVASIVSANSTGAYSFAGLVLGDYLVREVTPSGAVRTAPALTDTYAVTISSGSTLGGFDFDNFTRCPGTISNVSYKIINCDGTRTVTDLRGKTHQGDTVRVTFTVVGVSQRVTLVSYDAPGPVFVADDAYLQTIYDIDSQVFAPGVHTLCVTIPDNFYQIDFVKCAAIDRFGPAGSNVFYSAQGRLISADNAGTHSDVDDMAATTRFWANMGQSLIKAFNKTSSNQNPTNLGNWLASNFPNIYGPGGSNNMTGKSNSSVASLFLTLYRNSSKKTDASVLATALNVYASTSGLGGDDADSYGFGATEDGLGAALFSVGSNGAAFNVSNNTIVSVWTLLKTANSKSSKDVLYNNVSSMLTMAYNVFESINNAGGIH